MLNGMTNAFPTRRSSELPRTRLADEVRARAESFAAKSDRPAGAKGIALTPLARKIEGDRVSYGHVEAKIDRDKGIAEITIAGPKQAPPASAEAIQAQGDQFWSLALARELDDLILHLRTNEETGGMWVFRTHGDAELESGRASCRERVCQYG